MSAPTDGDTVVLTCSTTSSDVTSYEFFKDTSSLSAASSSSQYTVSSAAIGTDDGSYTCVVYIDTVSSDTSSGYDLTCKLILFGGEHMFTSRFR